ncbi:MAG: MoxR family ATPase [Oscillospiraceae bacterium]|nr:MoxR family ATPase [Oscillospiraceae bacterium]
MAEYARQVTQQVSRVLATNEQTVLWVLAAILAGGHVLLEDIPGVGKTTLAVALSQALGLQFGRVQFTPDVMPSDVVGYCVPKDGQLHYKPGPVMCNLFLADELNRATSRTQSALLEAMEENQVTVDGVCHQLPRPFVVIATQNPLGAAGTQPLPDSQLDRFALRLRLGYPGPEEEKRMLLQPGAQIRPVLTAEELRQLQAEVADTYVKETVADYAVRLMAATRKNVQILRGGSPRATLSVVALAKARARLQGRDFVIPEDVKAAFLQGVSHRILARGDENACLRRIVRRVRPPKSG